MFIFFSFFCCSMLSRHYAAKNEKNVYVCVCVCVAATVCIAGNRSIPNHILVNHSCCAKKSAVTFTRRKKERKHCLLCVQLLYFPFFHNMLTWYPCFSLFGVRFSSRFIHMQYSNIHIQFIAKSSLILRLRVLFACSASSTI